MKHRSHYFQLGLVLFVGLLGLFLPYQWDLTADQRFTLSQHAKEELNKLQTSYKIDVFLAGKLPPTFQRLRTEVETVLNNIQKENANIFVEYIDPFDTEDSRELVMQEMQQFGLIPRTVVSDNNQSVDQTVVFPWAIVFGAPA